MKNRNLINLLDFLYFCTQKFIKHMKCILFLHGFFASGNCVPALALQEELGDQYRVLTPDLPMHPKEALDYICEICNEEKPDLLVGNSCGSFYAQMLAPVLGIPALLGNPHFQMTDFLKPRMGAHQYKSPRADGRQDFIIDEQLISEFEALQQIQFHFTNPYYKDRVWGIFGEQDTLAHFEPKFLEHYNHAFHFPGAHTPTDLEVKTWYVPLIQKMLLMFEQPEKRYFQHFKGGKYKFIQSIYVSGLTEERRIEPDELEQYLSRKHPDGPGQERAVVYQALYGEHAYWLRPEKMFFEHVTRDGKTFSRFTETEPF